DYYCLLYSSGVHLF
nr:immunoglobulin light chain junction region [Macaca mulatta]MOV72311.1 immunoglobulin light chain junction region [Macaca mulatta]MOV72354.1 immunoglobulin light chain junction region [Macaca mulatta]MOV72450.1 immunoglobulin light chain junction region [Macaca mulatta]MOV72455.1 immunoglobulin light chain junction region [Macaca mulatta]